MLCHTSNGEVNESSDTHCCSLEELLHVPQSKRSGLPGSLYLIFGQEVGHRDAQQANRLVPAIQVSQQRAQNRHHRLCVLEPLRAANAPRVELKIAPSDLEREGPPSQIEFDQAMFHLLGELLQDLYHALAVHEVALEGDLLPNRLAFPCRFDWPVVLAAHI